MTIGRSPATVYFPESWKYGADVGIITWISLCRGFGRESKIVCTVRAVTSFMSKTLPSQGGPSKKRQALATAWCTAQAPQLPHDTALAADCVALSCEAFGPGLQRMREGSERNRLPLAECIRLGSQCSGAGLRYKKQEIGSRHCAASNTRVHPRWVCAS